MAPNGLGLQQEGYTEMSMEIISKNELDIFAA